MKYDGTNLKEVLEAHKRWINQTEGWTENDRADLRKAYMVRADLSGADLRGADLSGANLNGARLLRADLREADLSGAGLFEAKLSGASLCEANLSGADLRNADLCDADLYRADLYGADLSSADLSWADLSYSDLSEARLCETDLRRAKNFPYIPMTCPDSGSFIGWKACRADSGKVIIKLLIPEDAKRSSGTGRKCRSDKAIVLEIQNEDGTKANMDIAYSRYCDSFTYKVGKTVVPEKPFNDNRWEECASGIHFFINRQEAVEYTC